MAVFNPHGLSSPRSQKNQGGCANFIEGGLGTLALFELPVLATEYAPLAIALLGIEGFIIILIEQFKKNH